jgi:hypothetical protein
LSLATNIVRRGANYYARAAVPKALQAAIGKREVWKSLGTTDATKARGLARTVIAALQSQWDALAQRQALTPADIEEAVWERYSHLVEADERFRSNLPTDEDLDEIWRQLEREFGEYDIGSFRIFESIRDTLDEDRKVRVARLGTLRSHAARGETSSVADVLKGVLAKRRLG